jgi:hypothetical protein
MDLKGFQALQYLEEIEGLALFFFECLVEVTSDNIRFQPFL